MGAGGGVSVIRREGGEGKGRGGPGVALRICNFPHGRGYGSRGVRRSRGGDTLAGVPGEPLQVHGVEEPGFHKPVREGNHGGEAVSTEEQNPRANSRQERRRVAHRTGMFIQKYLNLVRSYPQ